LHQQTFSMKGLTIQRIISYILIPIGILLAFNVINGLIIAISNPMLLFVHFIIACVPIYIFSSSYFLFNGIIKEKKCKPSLKDWIKINAYVSIIFIAIILICSISVLMILSSPQILQEVYNKMPTTQFPGGAPSQTELVSILKIFISIMLPFCILLLLHIIKTFKLIKKYPSVFIDE
jgi:hypothetical protein